MAGTAMFDGSGVSPAHAGGTLRVYRFTGYKFEGGYPFDPDTLAESYDPAGRTLEYLPNVLCVSIRRGAGADPGEATFRYVLDSTGAINEDGAFPTSPSQVFGETAIAGPNVVQTDDRLCVTTTGADDVERILFDGFAQLPSVTFKANVQDVSFRATGTPVRCWDYPLYAGVFRSEDKPTQDSNDRTTEGTKIHFNPVGTEGVIRPNCTPKDADGQTRFRDDEAGVLAVQHAVFLDPDFCEDHKFGRFWTVSTAAKYILARGNSHQGFVLNPGVPSQQTFPESLIDFEELDRFLDGWISVNGKTIDYKDASTYTAKPIIVKDVDVTGLPWPEALALVIEPHGFRFCFRLGLDDDGFPIWGLDFYREAGDDEIGERTLVLQPEGSTLDASLPNLEEMNVTRDMNEVFNEWATETALSRHEADFVLAPLWEPKASDVTTENLKKFVATGEANKTVPITYRHYGFDECGEGHWDFSKNAMSFAATSLAKILAPSQDKDGKPISDADREKYYYVKRRRKCSRTLLSRDESNIDNPDIPDGGDDEAEGDEDDEGSEQDGKTGKRRRAIVLISWDYKGPSPGVWDGTGTWQIVRGWSLLDDRIGVQLTHNNLESWDTGNKAVAFGNAVVQASQGAVKAISHQALAGAVRFYLRLVTVIESDNAPDAVAGRRPTAASRFTVRKYIRADRKYRLDIIHGKTYFNTGDASVVSRDDTSAAKTLAQVRRAANEMPQFSGSVTIPRITLSYQIGHRITGVLGRDLSFRMNSGTPGESDRYPLVVGLEYHFGDEQKTILQIGDDRASQFQR